MNILILDDDENIGELIKLFIEQCGHTATVFQRVEPTKDFLKLNDIDLAIVDYLLHDEFYDGCDMIRYIKNEKDCPCVLITGRLETDDIPKVYDELLDKDFTFDGKEKGLCKVLKKYCTKGEKHGKKLD